ncbi:uncharacterized protein LOC114335142 [Diabrotica virgifera virgifera]|uniref:Uncharacterized protein LOC114335142 n=1 Tax=Diabrotica virgifera virgifera TaxID=50390 RepID=A0A6P7G270_DIAVI|nr:uncharacterized protein LOC114335142 [Diabrotica virgifera virgifera]
MAFTVYIVCVIAMASLVDSDYFSDLSGEEDGEFLSKNTKTMLGVDEVNAGEVLSGNKTRGTGNSKWILINKGPVRRSKSLPNNYVIETKSNRGFIWALKSESCKGINEIELIKKPEQLRKRHLFYFDNTSKKNTRIYAQQCNQQCLYIDELYEVKFGKNCDSQNNKLFDVISS